MTRFRKNFSFFSAGPQKLLLLPICRQPAAFLHHFQKNFFPCPSPRQPSPPAAKNPPNPKNPVRFLWEYGKIKRSHWQGTPFPAVFSEGSPVSCGNLSCSPLWRWPAASSACWCGGFTWPRVRGRHRPAHPPRPRPVGHGPGGGGGGGGSGRCSPPGSTGTLTAAMPRPSCPGPPCASPSSWRGWCCWPSGAFSPWPTGCRAR